MNSQPVFTIRKSRNGTVDGLRFAAAIGIVWFHAEAPFGNLTLSSLGVFVILLVVFGLDQCARLPFRAFIEDRAKRLLRPWLIWSVLYAILKLAQAEYKGEPIWSEFSWSMLATGTEFHLWFLPFGFFCLFAISQVQRRVDLSSTTSTLLLVLLGSLAIPVCHHLTVKFPYPPLEQWANAFPIVVFAIAIAKAGADLWRRVVICVGALGGWGLTGLIFGNWETASTPLAILVSVVGLTFITADRPWKRTLADFSMPVYLMHPAILSMLGTSALAPYHALNALLAVAACVLVHLCLRYSPIYLLTLGSDGEAKQAGRMVVSKSPT